MRPISQWWVRIRCPHCSTLMPPPFARLRVAVANTHSKSFDPHGKRCRVVVIPDPHGDAHEVIRVPDGQTFETVLQSCLERIAA